MLCLFVIFLFLSFFVCCLLLLDKYKIYCLISNIERRKQEAPEMFCASLSCHSFPKYCFWQEKKINFLLSSVKNYKYFFIMVPCIWQDCFKLKSLKKFQFYYQKLNRQSSCQNLSDCALVTMNHYPAKDGKHFDNFKNLVYLLSWPKL